MSFSLFHKMSVQEAKVLLPAFFEEVKAKKVRFPTIWDEKKVKQEIFTQLLSCKVEKEDGTEAFDKEQCLEQLLERYGREPEQAAAPAASKGKKRPAEGDNGGEEGGSQSSSPSKAKKRDTVTVEQNRAVAEVLQEMADEYFKLKEPFKGGVYSKAAKAIREAESYVHTSKEACKLKGIGKSIGGAIEEIVATGSCTKLEKLRAGEM